MSAPIFLGNQKTFLVINKEECKYKNVKDLPKASIHYQKFLKDDCVYLCERHGMSHLPSLMWKKKKLYEARKSSIDVLLSKNNFFPLGFLYPSAGHFAKAYGCWQPVMYQMRAIKNAQAVYQSH